MGSVTSNKDDNGAMNIENLPAFLSVQELATLLRKSPASVLRGIHGGDIPAVRVGFTFRIPGDYVISLHAEALRSVEQP
jgi:excisionase family DNA binding protein